MEAPRPLILVPLMGAWHLRHPRWNVVTVVDALTEAAPDAVWTTALAPGFERDPAWRDTDEIALPWTVHAWAEGRGTPLGGLGDADGAGSSESDAVAGPAAEAADFERLLGAHPAARAHLERARTSLRPLHDLLPRALDLGRILGEVVPILGSELQVRVEAFGDGPGTGHRIARARRVAARVAELGPARGALLVEVDLWPALVPALDGAGVAWRPADAPETSEAARLRSLLDVAWRGDAADPAGVLRELRALDLPEARYLEAQLLLAHDHAAEALEVLERAALGDFREPYLLPGMLLARLGQLRDLAGRRDRALQGYRGALALRWAPAVARAAAEAGLRAAFERPAPAAAADAATEAAADAATAAATAATLRPG